FPALRLGYLVAPIDLVDTFIAAKALADRHAPSVEQAVLADFITEGHFARHVRRTRVLYAARQAALVDAAKSQLAGLLAVGPAEAGMHLVGYLPEGVDDHAAARRAAAYLVDAPALSAYALTPQQHGGLLLGYAAVSQAEIYAGVRRLATALRA
ncbi:MAG: PLP-dependent aminotransferase family protein, partial [Roseiflexaceae bacterium]